jgi:hypothetical protein
MDEMDQLSTEIAQNLEDCASNLDNVMKEREGKRFCNFKQFQMLRFIRNYVNDVKRIDEVENRVIQYGEYIENTITDQVL